MTRTEQLDEVLRFFKNDAPIGRTDADIDVYVNGLKNMTFEERVNAQRKIQISDITRIAEKLKKDGYLDFEDKAVSWNYDQMSPGMRIPIEKRFYYINFDGNFFIESGGYTGKEAKENLEAKRINDIEAKSLELSSLTVESSKTLARLTWVIAIGTAIAAAYYIFEIWKYYYGYINPKG